MVNMKKLIPMIPSEYVSELPSSANDFLAMYSSVAGGIITDPTQMVVPLDDHIVHRGHAVFDTCNIQNGNAYGLDMHLDRLFRSAKMARIQVYKSKEELRKIIVATIAASQKRNGVFCRFWMSAGRGDFGIKTGGCTGTTFYVIVHTYLGKGSLHDAGVKEYIVDVPLKPKLLANMKSNNYLLNALCAEQSAEKGGYLGIQLTPDGNIAEGAIGNVGIVDSNGIFKTPPINSILDGTTVRRALAQEEKVKNMTKGALKGMEYCVLTKEDLYTSKECISLGGGGVCPIVEIDDIKVGDGRPGPIFRGLRDALYQEMDELLLDEVPYDDYKPVSVSGPVSTSSDHSSLNSLTYVAGGILLGIILGKKVF